MMKEKSGHRAGQGRAGRRATEGGHWARPARGQQAGPVCGCGGAATDPRRDTVCGCHAHHTPLAPLRLLS